MIEVLKSVRDLLKLLDQRTYQGVEQSGGATEASMKFNYELTWLDILLEDLKTNSQALGEDKEKEESP